MNPVLACRHASIVPQVGWVFQGLPSQLNKNSFLHSILLMAKMLTSKVIRATMLVWLGSKLVSWCLMTLRIMLP